MNNQIQLVLKSSTTELSLNDHELGIYLVPELDGLTGLPEIRTTSGVNSGYDGGWTSAQHYDARSITIRGVIANTDVATVERLRKQLVSLAGQGKQEELTLDLVTEAGNAYTLQVRTIALEMAMKGVLEKQEFMLQLRADDPLIYDNAESTHEAYIQVSKATGGFTINFDLPLAITGGSEETVISNDGLEQVPTITRLYGELHNPKIINQTTNQSMQINADLGFSEGQWVDASEVVTGKTINIEDAPDNAPLASFRLDGETSQNGTPTPSAPVAVKTVTGENVVKISDGQGNEQSYEVNLGKNLFDKDANQYLYGYFDNSSLQIVSASSTGRNGVVYLPCEPSTTYTINAQSLATCNIRAISTTEVLPANGVAVPREIAAGFDAATFTTPSSAHYIVIRYRTTSAEETIANNIQTIMASLQVEKGSTATSYAAYFEPIELCKIGDYQDYIYKSGDKWYLRKEVGKNTLSSSSNWYYNSSSQGFSVQFSADRLFSAYVGFCTHAEVQTSSATWTGVGKCGWNTSNTFWFEDGGAAATSAAGFKTWLDSNIVNVYYALATPTDTEITNEALVAQLETLLNTARTYAGVNNIFTVTPNEQGTLEISYYTHKTADNRDEIVIDSRLRTVTLNGLDIYHLIETGSEFLMLAPGENKLSLQSDITGDNGYAEVSYKQGYLSI